MTSAVTVAHDVSESPLSPKFVTEHVLHLPPFLTKSIYPTLLGENVAPRAYHLEGRFGSRTHKIDRGKNGIPILFSQTEMEELGRTSNDLRELLLTEGVEVVEKAFVHNHRSVQTVPVVDSRIHPELEPGGYKLPEISPREFAWGSSQQTELFTYAEMFGGIGGFGVALEALGGRCKFYSEIEETCRETYKLNFKTASKFIYGDIYEVPDDALPCGLDLLVAGFPCQPFSSLGDQSGFDCKKGRGHLYLQIVRVLRSSKPKAFLLENVQGLFRMRETLDSIVQSFRQAGYRVTAEVCTAKGLTATSRKRLFFVGIRHDLIDDDRGSSPPPHTFDSGFFKFPFIPDLKLCSHDVIDYDELPDEELEVLRLEESTFEQLSQSGKWKPNHLAWPNKQLDTLTSHYGNAVGRGESQLVPSSCPFLPRRFSVRECARVMGFPNNYSFRERRDGQGEMAYRKENYRMIGNAVCPPLIAALAGSVLDAAGIMRPGMSSWTEEGRRVAIDLSRASLRSRRADVPMGCLVPE